MQSLGQAKEGLTIEKSKEERKSTAIVDSFVQSFGMMPSSVSFGKGSGRLAVQVKNGVSRKELLKD